MTLDVKELRRLAEAATRGPWRWRFSSVEQLSDGGQGYPLDTYPDCVTIQESQCDECGNRIGLSDENGKFIAAASPSTVLALIEEAERLRHSGRFVCKLICCGRDDGEQAFDTWKEADEFRAAYVDAQGHERQCIIVSDQHNILTSRAQAEARAQELERRLAAVTAARDEACDLATSALAQIVDDRDDGLQSNIYNAAARIASLRKVGR